MARPLPSTASAAAAPASALFGSFSATMGLSDFPLPCIIVLAPQGFTMRAGRPHTRPGRGISQLPCNQLPDMPWFFDRAGTCGLSPHYEPTGVAFRVPLGRLLPGASLGFAMEAERSQLLRQGFGEMTRVLNRWIDPKLMAPEHTGSFHRVRLFDFATTMQGFLWQVLQGQAPCREVVQQLEAMGGTQNAKIPDSGTALAENRIVFLAGSRSYGPGEREFNAGGQILAKASTSRAGLM